jgi:hypothetical protein
LAANALDIHQALPPHSMTYTHTHTHTYFRSFGSFLASKYKARLEVAADADSQLREQVEEAREIDTYYTHKNRHIL